MEGRYVTAKQLIEDQILTMSEILELCKNSELTAYHTSVENGIDETVVHMLPADKPDDYADRVETIRSEMVDIAYSDKNLMDLLYHQSKFFLINECRTQGEPTIEEIENYANNRMIGKHARRYVEMYDMYERLHGKISTHEDNLKYIHYVITHSVFCFDIFEAYKIKGMTKRKFHDILFSFKFLISDVNSALKNIKERECTDMQAKHISTNIAAWEAVIPKLKAINCKNAAKLAIEKWKGKTHKEAYMTVFPQKRDSSKKTMDSYVSRARRVAEKIAREFGLTMPSWATQ